MVLLIEMTDEDPNTWVRSLQARVPGLDIRIWPEVGAEEDIELVLVSHHEHGDLRHYPNLKVILNLGAGVDHVFEDPDLPDGVPITRIVDPDLSDQMSAHAACAVLYFNRHIAGYVELQRERRWQPLPFEEVELTCIGVMGIGVIGGDTARKVKALGFDVLGWSRSEKELEGIRCFHGPDGLRAFLGESNMIICVLPLTAETRGIINKDTLGQLPRGAYVINVARGGHVVDADLLAALDSGQIAGAALDVFHTEPLPPDHPYWVHPKVLVTPHMAGEINPRTASLQLAENIDRVRKGQPLLNVVDPKVGY